MGKLVADIIVETLQNAGVKHCYGIVGDTLNLIARSLEKSEIEWVSVRHEEAGAFAAQAEAQVADRLTAVAGSCGPGSLHFINGIYEANRNRAPQSPKIAIFPVKFPVSREFVWRPVRSALRRQPGSAAV